MKTGPEFSHGVISIASQWSRLLRCVCVVGSFAMGPCPMAGADTGQPPVDVNALLETTGLDWRLSPGGAFGSCPIPFDQQIHDVLTFPSGAAAGQAWVETTVTGPAVIAFQPYFSKWMPSPELGGFEALIDGELVLDVRAKWSFFPQILPIPSGTHVVRFSAWISAVAPQGPAPVVGIRTFGIWSPTDAIAQALAPITAGIPQPQPVLPWRTGEGNPWTPRSFDLQSEQLIIESGRAQGVAAGPNDYEAESWVETDLIGPATLQFDGGGLGYAPRATPHVTVDGVREHRLAGHGDVAHQIVIPPGHHTVRWTSRPDAQFGLVRVMVFPHSAPTPPTAIEAEDALIAFSLRHDPDNDIETRDIWTAQSEVTHDGIDALAVSRWSGLTVSVLGPARVSYWYRTTSESNLTEALWLNPTGVVPPQEPIPVTTVLPGAVGVWTQRTVTVPPGWHQWQLYGIDGWVDELSVQRNGYAQWATAEGLSAAAADPLADPDRDGCANIFEWINGTLPQVPNGGAGLAFESASPGSMAASVLMPQTLPTDVELSMQMSENLIDWTQPTAVTMDASPGKITFRTPGSPTRAFVRFQARLR
jgi:hypothetical protein